MPNHSNHARKEASGKIPLGYIQLPNGAKPIYPMNDIFTNYTFERKEYWETLREIANIIIDAYTALYPNTTLLPITGIIEVETQFQYLLNTQNKTRKQDVKLIEDLKKAVYMELQNRAKTDPPIEIRSVDYFGLGIGYSKGNPANQIWLLAEDVPSVLRGGTFARYVLRDEKTGDNHPATSGILYVSLTKLSQQDSVAGELALFLLGKLNDPKHEIIQRISVAFRQSFGMFKEEKEVPEMLSLAERYHNEGVLVGEEKGEARGMAKGLAEGVNKMLEMIKSGLDPEEAARRIADER